MTFDRSPSNQIGLTFREQVALMMLDKMLPEQSFVNCAKSKDPGKSIETVINEAMVFATIVANSMEKQLNKNQQ